MTTLDLTPGINHGELKEVVEGAGTGLVGDHALGATTLNVAAGGFRVAGQLRIDGNTYSYTRSETSDALTITPGLVAAAENGTPVEALDPNGEPEVQKIAVVDLDMTGEEDGTDLPRAAIPGEWAGFYQLGTAQAGAMVNVEETSYGYRVTGQPDQAPLFDGGQITPGSIPEDATGPAEPPADSPDLETTGTVDTILLEAVDPMAASTHVTYQISTNYDPVTTTGTWADLPNMPTRESFYPVTKTATGDPLVTDTVYWFRALAGNSAGNAPAAGAPASGQLDPDKATEATEVRLAVGDLTVGRLNFGEGDDRGFWDPDIGISMPQSNGQTTLISADPAVPSNWAGKVVATFATILGGILQGLFEVIGTIRLAAGVTKPKSVPEVAATWDSLTLDTVLAEPSRLKALFEKVGDATEWAVLDDDLRAMVFYDKTTGAETPGFPVDGDHIAGTKIGSFYYLMGIDLGQYRIRQYDASGTVTGSTFTGVQGFDVHKGAPVLGTDGTNIIMAWPIGGNEARVRTYTTGFATLSNWTVDLGSNPTLAAVTGGGFEPGVTSDQLVIWKANGDATMYSLPSGSRNSSRDFPRANGNTVKGAWWDGTRFHSLNTDGRVHAYDTPHVAETRSVAYSFVSEDGTKETEPSPTVTYTRPPRSRVLISMPPPPEAGQTGASKANRLGVYYGATGALKQQTELAAGTNTYTVVGAATTGGKSPETSNGFAGTSAPGILESETGNGTTPHTRISGDGAVRMAKFMQSGTILLSTQATVGSITFPVPFDTAPRVVLTTDVRGNVATCDAPTTTGVGNVRIQHVNDTAQSNVTVTWVATTA